MVLGTGEERGNLLDTSLIRMHMFTGKYKYSVHAIHVSAY